MIKFCFQSLILPISMGHKDKKIVFLAWSFHSRRTQSLSESLSAKDYYHEYLKKSPKALLPLRYLIQSIVSLKILILENPDIVIVQNPPIFLAGVAFLYSKLAKAKLIIDSHTGAFIGRWEKFNRLHKYLSRKATLNIVTNKFLAEILKKWQADVFVLEDKIPDLPITKFQEKEKRFSICVVNSFSEDEPIEEIIDAAKNLVDCDFYITGRILMANPKILEKKVANIIFTDFIPDAEYFSLLNKVDAVMVLTKRDLTMVCGAYESVAVEKPLIISDWPVLRNYFSKGALYVDNSVESIEEAVREVKSKNMILGKQMKKFKKILQSNWNEKFNDFIAYF